MVAAVIDEHYRVERDGRIKTRLLAIKLACRGQSTAQEIAEICGVSRGRVFEWFKAVRAKGLEALLVREKPGPKEGSGGPPSEVAVELTQKLQNGDFITAVQAQRWLKQKHEIDRPYKTVWGWLKKAGGVLLVPRPSHSRKVPGAAEQFREGLAQKLADLALPKGALVKLWVMDEARFGLHTQMRRLWACKGQRPVVSRQIKYQWDYLYGSLDVMGGRAHFCQIPSVNLEWDQVYLEKLVEVDREAIHVVIRDQAGFHLRDGDDRLPDRVRIIDLPPYSPELNPCEQLWDLVKDEIGNQVFETVEALREAMIPALRRFWEDAGAVLRLIGRDWIRQQANSSLQIQESL